MTWARNSTSPLTTSSAPPPTRATLPGAQKLWEAADANGDIYKKSYSGLYCVGCEQFYTPDELTPEGLCPEHLTRPELVEEENYFFRLSRYGDRLAALIESGAVPHHARVAPQRSLSFIRMGLADFSISRSQERAKGWGIPVPGDPGQVIYVWFDALTNYITALDYATEGAAYQHYWVENANRVHCIGKGIIRFHAIYWPAMLLSAGVRPPSVLFVHGYVTANGLKISKSLGNAVDPSELVEKYGTEAVRYYLLREVPGHRRQRLHGREVREPLQQRPGERPGQPAQPHGQHDRALPRAAWSPPPATPDVLDQEVRDVAAGIAARLRCRAGQLRSAEALEAVWRLVTRANRYVEQTAPWTLAKAAKGGDASAAPTSTPCSIPWPSRCGCWRSTWRRSCPAPPPPC